MIKRAKIQDIEVEYEVIHRKVKYARLEIKTDKIRLIMPLNYNEDEEIIKKHEKWIYNKISRIKASQKEADNKELNFVRTHKEFKDMVISSVEKFSSDTWCGSKQSFLQEDENPMGKLQFKEKCKHQHVPDAPA